MTALLRSRWRDAEVAGGKAVHGLWNGAEKGGAAGAVATRKGDKDHLTRFRGPAASSLDALSSVAYGPEGIVLVLVAAGSSALLLTLPITLAIVGLLLVLVVSYCQVIAVHPDRGGACAVDKKDLGE